MSRSHLINAFCGSRLQPRHPKALENWALAPEFLNYLPLLGIYEATRRNLKSLAFTLVRREAIGLALLFAALGSIVVARSQATSPAPQTDLSTITYRRVFQGSTPEFVEIAVRQDGSARADVRQLADSASPQEFQVGAEMRGKIFDLAREMHNFQRTDLDAHRRVAYLGEKTFRWEKGAEAYETKYNYTVDAKATQLQRIFENLAQEQADLATLEQQSRYDRLGINDALRQFEDHLRQHVLPEPARFLPVLDRIAEDSRLLEMARQRARSLAAEIRVAQGL